MIEPVQQSPLSVVLYRVFRTPIYRQTPPSSIQPSALMHTTAANNYVSPMTTAYPSLPGIPGLARSTMFLPPTLSLKMLLDLNHLIQKGSIATVMVSILGI